MNKITQILLASTSFTALVLGAQNAAHAASLTPTEAAAPSLMSRA
ncbi:MAG TPA: hypothetical protein VIJ72_05300 [Rhizomicrobium sp.]